MSEARKLLVGEKREVESSIKYLTKARDGKRSEIKNLNNVIEKFYIKKLNIEGELEIIK